MERCSGTPTSMTCTARLTSFAVGRRLLLLLLAVAAVATACGSDSDSGANTTGGGKARPSAVVELTTILQLRGAFNEDRGKPRLLLLLSPT
jgi:hypothetical protein